VIPHQPRVYYALPEQDYWFVWLEIPWGDGYAHLSYCLALGLN